MNDLMISFIIIIFLCIDGANVEAISVYTQAINTS